MDLNGYKVWERDYVRYGNFTGISFTESNDVLISGSKWIMLTDHKFYIKWEDTTLVSGSIQLSDINQTNSVFVSVDSIDKYFLSYSITGKKIGQSKIISDNDDEVTELLLTNSNNAIVAGINSSGGYLTEYSLTGNSVKKLEINNQMSVVAAIKSSNGNISYLLKGDDYLVVTFSSAGL